MEHASSPSTWEAKAGKSLSSSTVSLQREFQDSQDYTENPISENKTKQNKTKQNKTKQNKTRAGTGFLDLKNVCGRYEEEEEEAK